ncbi:spinster family MFS transporter [Candidatus Foliamicus sp.]
MNSGRPSPLVAWYAVGVLMIAFIFSFLDRLILSLLVPPIMRDLEVSNFAIGLLGGLYFAIFYALMGLPIGRLADRSSRKLIVSAGIFLWSAMTVACGLARNFWHLALARVGVGVGEATLSPCAYSLISDYFPRERLGTALGVFQCAAFIGAGVAFLVGAQVIELVAAIPFERLPPGLAAFLTQFRPWQLAFMIVGLPGVLVALLALTIREPVRQGLMQGVDQKIPWPEVARFFSERWRMFLAHFFGFAILAAPIANILLWGPTHMIRNLGYSASEAGRLMGWILLLCSPAAVLAGGWFTDFLRRRGRVDAPFLVGIVAAAALTPLCLITTQLESGFWTLALMVPYAFFGCFAVASGPAALQLVAPNQLRATVSAVWMLALNILSAAAGPTAVGLVIDGVFGYDEAVGRSIALVGALAAPVAGIFLLYGLKHFRNAAQGE